MEGSSGASSGLWGISLSACLSLVLVLVAAMSDELPPPESVSLSLSSDHLSRILQWNRPAGLHENCEVVYQIELYLEKCPPSRDPERRWRTKDLNHTLDFYENEVCIKIFTFPSNCPNKRSSQPVYKDSLQHTGHSSKRMVSPLDIVKNFTCVYYSRMKMNCSWSLTSEVSDLQLFYSSWSGGGFKPCVSYIGNGLRRTGCHLNGEEFLNDTYHFLINGSDKSILFKNQFEIIPRNSVEIPPLKLNITTDHKHIHFLSSVPDFQPICWNYHFYYNKCNEAEQIHSVTESHIILEYDETCSYTVRVQAIYSAYCGTGRSEMSEPVIYGMDRDPNWPLKMAVIVIPVIVSCCLILSLVLCRRHKESIFPKIPAPPLLLKDVLNNNKEKDLEVGKLYVPHEDVVEKISVEPESTFHQTES